MAFSCWFFSKLLHSLYPNKRKHLSFQAGYSVAQKPYPLEESTTKTFFANYSRLLELEFSIDKHLFYVYLILLQVFV